MFLRKIKKFTPANVKFKISKMLVDKFGNRYGYYARRFLWDDVKTLLNSDSPVIVDGGSNVGTLVKLFLSQYDSPKIYAIEANLHLARQLSFKFKKNKSVIVVGKAIGRVRGNKKFDIANNLSSSSFFTRSRLNEKHHGQLTKVVNTITVEVVRLDSGIINEPTIDLLKLDLEGYELEALRGASGILNRTKIIVAEVSFAEIYKGAPFFSDVETYLRANNFQLLNLYNLYTHPDLCMMVGDALFVNKNFFKQFS